MQLKEREEVEEGEWSLGGEVHPAGIYAAEFTELEIPEPHPQYGDRLKLHFHTEHEREDTGEPGHIACFTSKSLSPKARVRPMLQAMGVDLDEVVEAVKERRFRLQNYIGKQLVLVIEHEPRKDGQGVNAVIKSFQPKPKAKKTKPNFKEADE